MRYLQLMRIKHYIKNLLIFLPLVFAGRALQPVPLLQTVWGFLAFSLLTSVVYIINDIRDIEQDRNHHIKRMRPLASGAVTISRAVCLAVSLFALAVIILVLAGANALTWLYFGLYLLMHIAYSLGLKNVPLLDIAIIVAGFLLRVLYGGALNRIHISHWMFLTVMAMSFYLALGKRRNEIQKVGNSARNVLRHYTVSFLDKNMYMCLALTIVFYSLWCVAPSQDLSNSQYLIWTIPIVILICMKYSMNIEGNSYGDPADVLFGDKVLLSLIALYALSVLEIIYGTGLISSLGNLF